jgi:hypothetical protein
MYYFKNLRHSLEGCDVVYFGADVPTFRRNLLPLSSGEKVEIECSSETKLQGVTSQNTINLKTCRRDNFKYQAQYAVQHFTNNNNERSRSM